MNRFIVILLAYLPTTMNSLVGGFAVFAPPTIKLPPHDVSMIQPQEDEHDYMPPALLPPIEYRPAISTQRLSRMDMQRAIADVKRFMENRLEQDLNLIPVSNVFYTFHFTSYSEDHVEDESQTLLFSVLFMTAHGSIGIPDGYRCQ
jgi:hypothetical protein